MTRLKAMDDEDKVFTVTVADGQLTLSLSVKAVTEDYDPIEFSAWVSNNAGEINEVVRVAINHEEIAAKEQAVAK